MADGFTPLTALAGGALIGLAAVMLMAATGRIAGISGIAARLLPPAAPGALGRVVFLAGLVAAPLAWAGITGAWPAPRITTDLPILLRAGLLVGFGAVLGNGCTSGHGICGLSRMSVRSLVATVTFMATAMAAVYVARLLG
jgi:uncharacterized membrane protein YedE/YeeE